ncbi:protein SCO1/2 [Panacagrimonas perspica]|uniref:Protein SCO1/2 n=1 Tax=Panacagrimonas perspica TaxID=381431 RepID=A0A4R7PFG5_9GAMM|nr:SCO family protein [Panacagrimonas perspica]TDU32522.1 protein SCO1/2 [Panacagrimonas perspica]THD05430.1 SCO family protein [Panacagrimonas perspica]
MSSPVKALTLGVIAAIAAIAGLVVANFVFKPDQPAGVQIASGTLLPSPRAIPEFALTGGGGQPFTKAGLNGQWSVIFVGFTHCPDVCPNTLAKLKAVHSTLATQNKPLQVLFLSVDPERDTPPIIASYVTHFDPAFVGATGPKEELDKLGSAMGFIYMKSPGATPETYSIDHSSALILINPQAQVAGYFTQPLKVDELVADLGTLIEPSGTL